MKYIDLSSIIESTGMLTAPSSKTSTKFHDNQRKAVSIVLNITTTQGSNNKDKCLFVESNLVTCVNLPTKAIFSFKSSSTTKNILRSTGYHLLKRVDYRIKYYFTQIRIRMIFYGQQWNLKRFISRY